MRETAELLLVCAAAGYIVYPLAVRLFAWMAELGRARIADPKMHTLPKLSVVIAANEDERTIRSRLQDVLAADYPSHLLKVILAVDGADCWPNGLSKSDARVVVLLSKDRIGKAAMLNRAIPHLSGEVVVLTDADTRFAKDALRAFVRRFADSSVGLVSGCTRIVHARGEHGAGEKHYMSFENGTKLAESVFGVVQGVSGEVLAVRRELFVEHPPNAVVEDVWLSNEVAAGGWRIEFEPTAIVYEWPTTDFSQDLVRRSRIVAGGVREAVSRLLDQRMWRQPVYMFCMVCHRLIRWLFAPAAAIAGVVLALVCAACGNLVCVAATGSLLVAAALWMLAPRSTVGSIIGLLFIYHVSYVIGLWRVITGSQDVVWRRARKTATGFPEGERRCHAFKPTDSDGGQGWQAHDAPGSRVCGTHGEEPS